MKIKLELEVDTDNEHDVELVEKLVEVVQDLNKVLDKEQYDE